MASKEKRHASLRHLARELVRENFSLFEVFNGLADAMEEEAKRIEVNPTAREEVLTLEREALALRKLARDHRSERV